MCLYLDSVHGVERYSRRGPYLIIHEEGPVGAYFAQARESLMTAR